MMLNAVGCGRQAAGGRRVGLRVAWRVGSWVGSWGGRRTGNRGKRRYPSQQIPMPVIPIGQLLPKACAERGVPLEH